MKDPILAIFMRTDLNMSRGKIAVQAGHAVATTIAVQSKWDGRAPYISSSPVGEWMEKNQTKIVLAVDSKDELDEIAEIAKRNKVSYIYVYDIGKTELEPGTVTCLAVGIDSRARVSKITEGWKTLR